MATFQTDGLDEIIRQMGQLGEDLGETADEMLLAGAAQVQACWKQAAEDAGHRRTGGMIQTIKFPRKPKTVDGIRIIDVYPRGSSPTAKEADGSASRYAAIAFRLHYGTSRYPGSRFVDAATAKSEPRVLKVYQTLFEKLLQKKGLI